MPYTGKTNLAATNPNLKPIPKPGTYPNRSGTGKQPYPGRKPVGNVPGGSLGTTKPGGYPGGYKPGAPGKPAGNLAATKPYKPMAKPTHNMMRNPGGGGANRGVPNGSFGGSKPGGSSQAHGNRHQARAGGAGRNPGAAGGAKGAAKTGRRPGRPTGGG